MLPPNIQLPTDLQTTHAETVKGFLSQALAKTTKADVHLVEAKRLASVLQRINDINQILADPTIQNALVAASGISDKARNHLSYQDMQNSLAAILKTIAVKNPADWKDEIVYRYLLTRGDTLGGTMRNYIGALGGRELSASVIASLNRAGLAHRVVVSSANSAKVTSLEWLNRVLVFDRKPKFVDKNIDAILLDTTKTTPGIVLLESPNAFVACGELKGGIDPGGADEHWKTAGSAFQRIRDVFVGGRPPHLFFVAAAIEASMAREIYSQLQSGQLEYAANLTHPQQTADLTDWLVSL